MMNENQNVEDSSPINLFSRKIPLGNSIEDEIKRRRIMYIESAIAGAFVASVYAIISISKFSKTIDKYSIEAANKGPSLWIVLLIFIVCSILAFFVDKMITQRRVDNYNASNAGVNVSADDATEETEQDEEGVPEKIIEMRNDKNNSFSIIVNDEVAGNFRIKDRKVSNSKSLEYGLCKITSFTAEDALLITNVVDFLKEYALNNGLVGIMIPTRFCKEFIIGKENTRYDLVLNEKCFIQESFPGSLHELLKPEGEKDETN